MVITFVPFASIGKSLSVLDSKRLMKQRVEALQIWNTLNKGDSAKGWKNHPSVLMWKGAENFLALYYNTCLGMCIDRGYENNMKYLQIQGAIIKPWWWGYEPLHLSHQSSLNRKHPAYYKFNTGWYQDYGYFWPSHHYNIRTKLLGSDPTYLVNINTNGNPGFEPINTSNIKSLSESKKLLYTVNSLKMMAKEQGYKGLSKMRKDDLLKLLNIDVSD